MPAYLVLKADATVRFPLDKPIIVLGRSEDCDVIIKKSMKLSRRHCCIAQVNSRYVIRDLGSMNGIKINQKRTHEEVLGEGDEISLGDVTLVFTLMKAATKSKPATPPPLKASGEASEAIAPERIAGEKKEANTRRGEGKLRSREGSRRSSSSVNSGKSREGKSRENKKGSNRGKPNRGELDRGELDSGDLDVGGLSGPEE